MNARSRSPYQPDLGRAPVADRSVSRSAARTVSDGSLDGVAGRALSLECFDRSLKSEAVARFDRSLRETIDQMLDLMRRERYVALSGPMVGLPLRVVAVDLAGTGQSQIVLINPVIEQVSTERHKDREGCLVVPGIVAHVARPASIVVSGLSPTGQPVRLQAGGILARILQHHIDHLEGRTFFDRVDPRDRRHR